MRRSRTAGSEVSGSAFSHADDYTVKLEGAVKIGYQAVVIGGMRDPYFIRNLDTWLPTVERRHREVRQRHPRTAETWQGLSP